MKRRNHHIASVLLCVCCIALQPLAFGQKIQVKIDRSRIFIGEQINLHFSVENSSKNISWFLMPDTINHLEVVYRSKIDTVSTGVNYRFSQDLRITSFDSGMWQIPAFSILGINQTTNPINIEVVPVDVSGKKDYNEIKEIEEVNVTTSPFLIEALIGVSLISIIMLVMLLRKRVFDHNVAPVLSSDQTPLQWATEQLQLLRLQDPLTYASAKIYFAELNRISRTFFNMQLQQDNRQLTTDEWMIVLSRMHIDSDRKTSFFQFLRLSDSVRFAKYTPARADVDLSLHSVKAMLQGAAVLHLSNSKFQPATA